MIEPAAPMLNICRQRAEEHGFLQRCTFHEGYLDSLPPSEPFDAATSLLMSHFLTEPDDRRAFFQEIASRLRPGGYLISADIASDTSTPKHTAILNIWMRAMAYAGIGSDEIENMRASLGQKVSVLPPEEVAAIIASGGFEPPVLGVQSLLTHGWYTRRTS